jgi:hypothetical protein
MDTERVPTDPRSAVCKSISDGPLGLHRRLELRQELKKGKSNRREGKSNRRGDVPGAFEVLLKQAVLYADKHRLASLWWGRLHYVLGVPAAILATLAGATALHATSSQTVPAILALTAGGLSAAVAFLKCENSRDRNSALCAGWTELADQVRMALLKYDNDERQASADYADYTDLLLYLNKCKMELLWGMLRAGPERKGFECD